MPYCRKRPARRYAALWPSARFILLPAWAYRVAWQGSTYTVTDRPRPLIDYHIYTPKRYTIISDCPYAWQQQYQRAQSSPLAAATAAVAVRSVHAGKPAAVAAPARPAAPSRMDRASRGVDRGVTVSK